MHPSDGPATSAARRRHDLDPSGRREPRAYPQPVGAGAAGSDVILLAARSALLSVTTRGEAARVLRTAINDLGAGVVPARLAGQDVIPVDVSLGDGEPHLVSVEPLSVSRLLLDRHLPSLVQDALEAAARCDAARRQDMSSETTTDIGIPGRGDLC